MKQQRKHGNGPRASDMTPGTPDTGGTRANWIKSQRMRQKICAVFDGKFRPRLLGASHVLADERARAARLKRKNRRLLAKIIAAMAESRQGAAPISFFRHPIGGGLL